MVFSEPGYFGRNIGTRTMLIHIVRHGQSYNTHPADDDPSPENPPLTPVGEEQARMVAKRLRSLPIDRLIASPMLRTLDTARHIAAETGLTIEVWPRCYEYRETAGYRCQGARALRPLYPDVQFPTSFAEDDWEYGNESLETGVQRAGEFLRWLDAESANQAIRRMVVVSHGTFSRLVLGHLFNCDLDGLRRLWFDNTAVNTLELSTRGFRVLGLNDTTHLIGVDGLDPVAGITR
jgi:broad specificity phosphatase PhoE